MKRCPWSGDDPRMMTYHDEEWGLPNREDKHHFEFLILEAAQAGLSWRTVLHKREGYRKAFHDFDPKAVAKMGERDVARLMQDASIIRNRLKITAAIANAKPFIAVQKEFGSFDNYLWSFVKGKQVRNNIRTSKDLPAKTALSDEVSKDLKKRGFRFVGSTVIYSHLQAVGVVNDHERSCFRWKACCKR
ncbi:TPA: DNA-3-methyladenine glycosylase I [Candidatus Woesearchaeota archaeon]|nr:DNA-3-methyladenine glycosylase I [Candidatus Woesearchaeota archaeon]